MSLLDLQNQTTKTRIIALVHGYPKSGKTASTLSLTQIEGHTVGFIALDANSIAGLKAGMSTPTIPKNPANFKNFHIRSPIHEKPQVGVLTSLKGMGKTLAANSVTSLQAGASKAPKVPVGDTLTPVLDTIMGEFISDSGENLGDVSKWGVDHTLIIDSMSALVDAIASTTNGNNIILAQSNYFAVQRVTDLIVTRLIQATKCNIIFLAHSYLQISDSGELIVPAIFGQKGGLNLARLATEVLYATSTPAYKFITQSSVALCGSILLREKSIPQDLSIYYKL